MGQRNILCTNQMLDGEIHQVGQHHLHPEPCIFLGNITDFPRPNIYPVLSASGNTSNIDNGMFYGTQYNSIQHHHPMANFDFGGVPASNFYDPYMVPLSGRRNFPVPLNHGPTGQLPSSSNHGIIGVGLDEYEGNNHFMDGVRGSCKRKNAEGFPRNSQHANGSASSSSSSSSSGTSLSTGLHHWERQFESGAGMLDVAAFPSPEFGGNGILSVTEGGPRRSVRSRSNPIGLQLDSTLLHNHHHLMQGNFMGQSFQPACSTLMEQQFGSDGGDGGGMSTWNYAPTLPYLHGRSVSGGSLEIGGMGAQGYQDTTNGANSAVLFYPSSISHQHSQQHHDHHHLHLHPPPPQVQGMPSHNFSFHPQVPTSSYWPPTNNTFHHSSLNPPQDDTVPGSGYQRPLLHTGFSIYRPHRRAMQQALPEDGHRPRLRILPEDEVAILEFSGFGNFSDHHSDMRLDIDHMTYEELLALEERIGNVRVGLTEEKIIRHLKSRYHVSPAACINLDEPVGMDQDVEACIICQDEYENLDKIGTLDCGHEYHAECIRKWLLVKNVCPICKITALSVDGKE
ncbi:probable E3 ubiquitin-protein ligase ZFP1 isoform X2 [Macadamia integrifolia]|nr:probable E3 ubiquitin-protein ligase ZFP1 isoform X2 [Macadamia integrifolia]XP_042499987.1 probable E3 ubiquitin-protein ligase ZFP1 isoform X2 [Macadamia integrifolia]